MDIIGKKEEKKGFKETIRNFIADFPTWVWITLAVIYIIILVNLPFIAAIILLVPLLLFAFDDHITIKKLQKRMKENEIDDIDGKYDWQRKVDYEQKVKSNRSQTLQ